VKLQTITNLIKAVNLYKMYGPGHAATAEGAAQFHASIQAECQERPEVSFALVEGRVVIDGEPLSEEQPAIAKLKAVLEAMKIASVTFQRGFDQAETAGFVQYLATTAQEKEIKQFPHILLNKLAYVQKGAEGPSAGSSDAGTGGRQKGAQDPATQIVKLIGLMVESEKLTTRQIQAKLKEVLVEAGASSKWDAPTALRKVKEVVSGLDAEAKERLFGDGTSDQTIAGSLVRMFPPAARASFITEALIAGVSSPATTAMVTPGGAARDLSDALVSQVLARTADPAQQADLIAKGLRVLTEGVASAPPQQGTISKTIAVRLASAGGQRLMRGLSKSYQASYRVTKDAKQLLDLAARGTLDVVIVDEEGIGNLEEFFEEFRFRVTEGTQKTGELPRKTGPEGALPVVMITKQTMLDLPPAVMGYPRLELLSPDAELDQLVQLIGLGPGDARAESEPQSQEDVDKLQLDRAREVVQALLPQSIPEIPGIEVSTYYNPALHIGGDYLDIFDLGKNGYGITIADVSGKGVPGALVMTTFRSVLRFAAPTHTSPRDTMLAVNDLLRNGMVKGMFVTALYGVLDPATRTLRLANSGHNPALLSRKGAPKPEYVRLPGLVLGVVSGTSYAKVMRDAVLQLHPGDLLIWYTDGVTEAFNEKKEQFGDEHLLEIVAANRDLSAERIVKVIVRALAKHRGRAEQSDDIAIIAIKAK